MMKLLFDLNKDGPDALIANQNGWTALHCAVHTDDLATVKKFVSLISPGRLKALLNTADKNQREPLHIAAYKCTEEMVSYLMEIGASNTTKDSGGNNPSKLADRSGRRKSRELIEEKEKEGNRSGRASKEGVEELVEKEKQRRKSREITE